MSGLFCSNWQVSGLLQHLGNVLALAGDYARAYVGRAGDFNSADAETIAAELDGVGLSKVQAIVAYRDKNGFLTSPERGFERKRHRAADT